MPWPKPRIRVRDEGVLRTLHIGGGAVQSALRLDDPDALALDYVQALLAALLFVRTPVRWLMIGVGGGSLARFVHARLPAARVLACDIDRRVVEVARGWFFLPEDDERLEVRTADGARVLRTAGARDMIVLDAFDDGRQAKALASEVFYRAARGALAPGGALVVNYLADRSFDGHLRRLEAAFDGRVLCLPARRCPNVIAIALGAGPTRIAWRVLERRAQALDRSPGGAPFASYLRGLRRMNRHTERHLIIGREEDVR